jgi:D-cysteine desulfhydrase
LGILGYVNAAFEIKGQLTQMGEPEPDALFVAVGSCGTFAGLVLGARLAGLGSRILGVRIIEEDQANRPKVARMVNVTAQTMHRLDPSVPSVRMTAQEIDILDGYLGPGYAFPTEQARQAMARTARAEGRVLETTYTGKTMAALLDHAEQNPGTRLLFVDTLAQDPTLEEGDWRDLPEPFWPIFDPTRKARCQCLRSWRGAGVCWKKECG